MNITVINAFLCANNKLNKYENVMTDYKFMDYKQWHQMNIKKNTSLKKMNMEQDDYPLLFTILRWVGSVKGQNDPPDHILRDNPESLHARPIFQMDHHFLFQTYAGADCNGARPGNSGGKIDRFLDSMTQNNYPNRNLINTEGMKWNNTVIEMTHE